MAAFIDFNELKARVSLVDAIRLLGLKLNQRGNQWRGPCPTCKSGGDRALVITDGKGFYCFGAKKGGDQIALAAHIRNCGAKEAAEFLSGNGTVQGTVPGTVPESVPAAKEGTKTFAPLAYLEPEHDAVVAVGFDTDFCKKNGIGYAGKGILRGTVAIPFRDERGTLLGYIGITDAKLPPSFTPNVVDFKKSA